MWLFFQLWLNLSLSLSVSHTQAEDNLDIESSSCWSPRSKITRTFSRSLHGRSYNLNLVSNICKTAPVDLRSGPPTDSMNYQKYILNFPSPCLANWQWLFEQANHSVHSNPGTQVGTQSIGWSRPSDKGGGGGSSSSWDKWGGGAGFKTRFFSPSGLSWGKK